jgi:4-hydroxybenzoate polyprenyltransferase
MTVLPDPNRVGSQIAQPLVVGLNGALLKVDTIYESFLAALLAKPGEALWSLIALRSGIAALKHRLSGIARLNAELLPVHEELLAYLKQEASAGREIHLAAGADRAIGEEVARRFSIFATVQSTGLHGDLKKPESARRLKELFVDGFVYAGDSRADFPVWQSAAAAVVVSENASLKKAVQSAGIPIERAFDEPRAGIKDWIRAFRLHQWTKSAIVLVPVLLGWRDLTFASIVNTLIMISLLCPVVSLTYLVNDMADLPSDRKHWSKRHRPFAHGTIPVRDGMLLAGIGLPVLCGAGLLIAPLAGLCLLSYVVVTLGYSFSWKRIPVFDTFIIALLFTIRVLMGTAAAKLVPSPWLLTFSMFFFFSMAMAKRHSEILRAAQHNLQVLEGRGYRITDESLTLTFGITASMASILIVVIYLVEEVFARQIYHNPVWLWGTPIAIFLFSSRIWVLSHRGRMMDDPVAFALRDRVSIDLGIFAAAMILLAL